MGLTAQDLRVKLGSTLVLGDSGTGTGASIDVDRDIWRSLFLSCMDSSAR